MEEALLKVTGRVQGVFFRDNAQEKARELDLKGFVKNMSDGSVIACIQGKKHQIEDFIIWCHEGSPSAEIDHVEVTWREPVDNFNSFEIE
ncbi:MAG: acylphosphatase [Nitrospirota bacterium]